MNLKEIKNLIQDKEHGLNQFRELSFEANRPGINDEWEVTVYSSHSFTGVQTCRLLTGLDSETAQILAEKLDSVVAEVLTKREEEAVESFMQEIIGDVKSVKSKFIDE